MTYQGAEAAEERVPEVAEREGKVLVEEVTQELAHAVVRPTEYQHISSFGIKKAIWYYMDTLYSPAAVDEQ